MWRVDLVELRASLVQAATSAKLFEQTPGVKQNTRVGLYVSIFWFRGLVLRATTRPILFGVIPAIKSAPFCGALVASRKANIDYAEWASASPNAKAFANSS